MSTYFQMLPVMTQWEARPLTLIQVAWLVSAAGSTFPTVCGSANLGGNIPYSLEAHDSISLLFIHNGKVRDILGTLAHSTGWDSLLNDAEAP